MQTNRLTTKPTHEVIAAIQALDLTSVKMRMMDAELGEGWSEEYADSIEGAYKTFLTMVAKYQDHAEDIMLAKDVDEFWHAHILQTLKYAADCEAVFGNFLHHDPDVGPRTAETLRKREQQAETTRRLYQLESASAPSAAPAFCGVAVKAQQGGFCGVAAKAEEAAFCGVAVKAKEAAFCGVAVKAKEAAFCGVAVKAKEATFCGVAVKAKEAAFCGVAVDARPREAMTAR